MFFRLQRQLSIVHSAVLMKMKMMVTMVVAVVVEMVVMMASNIYGSSAYSVPGAVPSVLSIHSSHLLCEVVIIFIIIIIAIL